MKEHFVLKMYGQLQTLTLTIISHFSIKNVELNLLLSTYPHWRDIIKIRSCYSMPRLLIYNHIKEISSEHILYHPIALGIEFSYFSFLFFFNFDVNNSET